MFLRLRCARGAASMRCAVVSSVLDCAVYVDGNLLYWCCIVKKRWRVCRERGTFIVHFYACAYAVTRCAPRTHRHRITGYSVRVKPESHWQNVSASKFRLNCRYCTCVGRKRFLVYVFWILFSCHVCRIVVCRLTISKRLAALLSIICRVYSLEKCLTYALIG